MFIDASIIVALLADNPDAARFADRIAMAKTRFTSGLVIVEATMHLSDLLDLDPLVVETHIQAVLEEAQISVVPINAGIARKAVAAFTAYGKGRANPAQLTLADCLSYACAEAYRVPLLSKGGGFAQTDMENADR